MQLYFVRHAQSTNNDLFDKTGANVGRCDDPELTETGVEQAIRLAAYIKESSDYFRSQLNDNGVPTELVITHLYTSPMVRAVETSMHISRKIGIKPRLFKDIHGAGGVYLGGDVEDDPRVGKPGKNREYFSQRFPEIDLPDWVGKAGWWNRPYEYREERLPRAKSVIGELISRHGETNDQVMFVSHGAFYNYFLRALLEISTEKPCSFPINNASIGRIDYAQGKFSVVYLNRVNHLTHQLIT
jgi:2,3-bisphosphoglycerate-dependent phosphoglycerate mutase